MTRPESNEEWVLTPLDGVPRRPYTGMWATYLCDWYLDWRYDLCLDDLTDRISLFAFL